MNIEWKYFWNLMQGLNVNIQKVQWTPNKMNLKRYILGHIIIKLGTESWKQLQRINSLQRTLNVIITFFIKNFGVHRQWADIFKMLKAKDCQLRTLYLAEMSFKSDGEIKSCPDKEKLRDYHLIHIIRNILKKERKKYLKSAARWNISKLVTQSMKK